MQTKKKKKKKKKATPKKKATSKKTEPKDSESERKVLYVYKDKHNGMELDVYERGKTGAPPWWVTFRDRIGIIADNLKMNCKMSEALFEAGLTKDEYKYFKVIHPHFADYFESCKMYITNKAKGNVFHHIVEKKDVHVSKWHLETVENKEYKKQLEIKNSEISDDDRLKQLTAEQEYLKYKREKEEKDG